MKTLDRFLNGFQSLFLLHHHIPKTATIVRPLTLLIFLPLLIQRNYRLIYSSCATCRPGPKGPSKELIDAIVDMKRRYPTFGCPSIAQQVNFAFGHHIDKYVVRRVMTAHCPRNTGAAGPFWLSILGHTNDSIWSIDLFQCESILLNSHWILVIMDPFTRRIFCIGVTVGVVDNESLCYMFNKIISSNAKPQRLSSDIDSLFRYHRWQANFRILCVEEIKNISYSPTSHPFIERLIETIRLTSPASIKIIEMMSILRAFRPAGTWTQTSYYRY